MKNIQYEDLDDKRGYHIRRMTGVVEADQQDQDYVEYHAINPKNSVTAVKAATLDELNERVASLPQCYAEVDGYLVELTHDFGDPRDIVVNVYDGDGDSVGRRGNLPWSGGTADDVRECLPEVANPSKGELLDVVTLGRTPPNRPKAKN
jgi:hypothetical protein